MQLLRYASPSIIAAVACSCICSASGQQQLSSLLSQSCGPDTARFTVHMDGAPSSLPHISAGTGRLVVVPEAIGSVSGCRYLTTRVGIDGKWIGATCLGGVLVSEVTAGEHHLCVDLQQRKRPTYTGLHSLTVEPGSTYYFRAQAIDANLYEAHSAMALERLDPDEGQLLLLTKRSTESAEQK